MKLSVRVRGEWITVPTLSQENTIRWLGDESLRRYLKIKPASTHVDKVERVFEVRKTQGGALLDEDDLVKHVLDDNDFVSVVLESDHAIERMINAEITFVPEQIPGKLRLPHEHITVDGSTLSTDDLMRLSRGELKIILSPESIKKVNDARRLLDNIVKEQKCVYGVTTGFGKFANVPIKFEELEQLQENLIRSHAAGVGDPLSPEQSRGILALRINVLAKGYSGISMETLQSFIGAFNASCLPWIPVQGTVGASGDLAPLAHIALGLMGEGKMWSPQCGWGDAKYILEVNNLKPIKLKPKEGLALINGTQFITALGVDAVERADSIARQAIAVCALSLEVLKGTTKAFERKIHENRPHKGQVMVARNMRALLHSDVYPSEISESHRFCKRVQDAYTLRCAPQVHGIVHDTIDFVKSILSVEMNSATDNPMIFADSNEIISGGNFHGEYPAKACDYLTIGIHELGSMSERRLERLVNPAYSELPAFLVEDGGLNSGFMIAHCTAASIVSENKVYCHPSSVDSQTTSGGTEDHVSMGGFAARKAVQVVTNVERVIAIELLAACQALEFLRPLKTTAPLEEVYKLVRTVAKPWDKDRYMAPDIEAVHNLLKEEKIWRIVKPFIDNYNSKHSINLNVCSPTSAILGGKRRRLISENNAVVNNNH